LPTLKDKESEFVVELRNKYKKEMEREAFTCQRCGGRLSRKSGPYSVFLGYDNWKHNGCKYTRTLKRKEEETN